MRALDGEGERVTVRCRSPRPAATLELRGELPSWSDAIAMTPAGGGAFSAELRLGPGVYAIKARAPDDTWLVDPSWRTHGDDGVLVVGGTDEPVLHAPAAPWLTLGDDGRVRVRASVHRGSHQGVRIRCADGDRPMRTVGADADRILLEADLAGAGRTLEYAFVLADGRVVAPWLRVALADLPAPPPAWWRDAVVYTIFVDRFSGAVRGTSRDTRCGGTLDGVTERLPYLAELGATVLHLTPIVVAPSVHRYDAIDPRAVDPALGGDAALDRLLDAAHRRGLRVAIDVAVTHVDRDFAPFRDVRRLGPRSAYWHWFRCHRWPFFDGQDPGYEHYQKGQWQEPLLALDEPEVAAHLEQTVAHWVKRGADAIRIDAAADVPVPLVARLRAAARAVKRDVVVFGEVVPACAERWAPGALDAATDFAAREAQVAWLTGAQPAAAVERAALAQRRRGLAGVRGLGFTGTHDQPRIRTVAGAARARLGLLAVALGARVPLLYYGDELGLSADRTSEFEDSWPDRQPMPWHDRAAWDEDTLALVRAALALRRDRESLRRGDEEVAALSDDVVCVRRRLGDDVIDVLLHRGEVMVDVALPPGAAARVLLAVGDATLDGDLARLGPDAALVVDRRAARDPELFAGNAALADEAVAGAHLTSPAYPSRLYLTVTESCNLRCRHCITDAPARTTGGTARTLRPWLLDALDDAFAHAGYVAFTHGGESLTAPIFPEVLRRIARAPGRRDVHLVSNGTLLDADRVLALTDLGVNSVMVSLDGATAATSDRIRVLGRFDQVVANLAAAVELRATRGLDLRLGVSVVVGRSNLAELPALGRLCARLGVDWLKFEETYPATPFARADALDPDAPELAAAVAALRDAVAGASLVLVDHLAPDPEDPAFRAADDFANRVAFRPWRAAWDQAAIDPDGTVHAVDYAQPALGNLLDAPFLALWSAPPARELRARSVMLQVADRGPA